jgi:deoxyribose-phosphate aldolase
MAEYAKKYRFKNVHVLPCWVSVLKEMLADAPGVLAGAPVGFPSGGHKTEIKLMETELLIKDGAQEIDIVMNVGRFLNKEYGYVLDELKKIVGILPKDVPAKVIIEINTP